MSRVVRRRPSEHGYYIITPVWRGLPWKDLSWQEHAACRNAKTPREKLSFFGTSDGTADPTPGEIAIALRFCRHCQVKPACLEDAIMNRQMKGVWGGLTPRELRAFQRARDTAIRQITTKEGAA